MLEVKDKSADSVDSTTTRLAKYFGGYNEHSIKLIKLRFSFLNKMSWFLKTFN